MQSQCKGALAKEAETRGWGEGAPGQLKKKLWLVFEGPVSGPKKRPQPDRTRPQKDRTIGCGPSIFKYKDRRKTGRSEPVLAGLEPVSIVASKRAQERDFWMKTDQDM